MQRDCIEGLVVLAIIVSVLIGVAFAIWSGFDLYTLLRPYGESLAVLYGMFGGVMTAFVQPSGESLAVLWSIAGGMFVGAVMMAFTFVVSCAIIKLYNQRQLIRASPSFS